MRYLPLLPGILMALAGVAALMFAAVEGRRR